MSLEDNNLSNGQNIASGMGRATKRGLGQIGRKAGEKVAEESGRVITQIIGKVSATVGGSLGCSGLAMVLVVVIVVVMVCGFFQSANFPVSQVVPTPEAKCIIQMFESYVDETYDEVSEKELNLNEDSERDKYKSYYNQIIAQPYHQYVLCGLWKTVVYEYLCNDYERINISNGALNADGNVKNVSNYYEDFTQFYWEKQDITKNDMISFRSCGVKKDEYINRLIHWKYTNNLFKMCLSSFFDSSDKLITADNGSTEPSSTQATTNSQGSTESAQQRSSIDKEIKAITEKIFANLSAKMENCVVCYQSPAEDMTLKTRVEEYMAYLLLDSDSSYTQDYVVSIFDSKKPELYNNMQNKVISSSSGFYTLRGSTGNVSAMIQLARQQVGNTGHKYARESKCWGQELGNTPWCCIYLGWLIEQSGGYPSEVGWSASVVTWQKNAAEKGLYQSASNYDPVPGDIFIEGNCMHVGLIVETYNDGTVLTSEGNASNDPNSSSKVCEYRSQKSRFSGYIVINKVTSLLKASKIDSNYKGQVYNLSSSERTELERIVEGEFGCDYEGAVLIAQCLRDALVSGLADSPMTIRKQMGYDGYKYDVSDNARNAVRFIFDEGGVGVQHRIIYMYATYITSEWHETQEFIIEVPCLNYTVRFFDRRD